MTDIKLVTVKTEDYAAAIANVVDKGLIRQLEIGLRREGQTYVVMEDKFFEFIKSAINDAGVRCSCGNTNQK